MYNFFVKETQKQENSYIITDSDFNHIKNVLRMRVGEEFLVSCEGRSDLCRIEEFEAQSVVARIIEENYNSTELPVKIYLFQGLPKSDKMELIIQKCVELGAYAIVPVEMSRCIVKLDGGKKDGKISRWQTIAESAAKQSKRNVIPQIMPVMSYKAAVEMASKMDLFMIPYEAKDGMAATKKALDRITAGSSVAIMIGPEGGFEEREVEQAVQAGGCAVSLGKRILRTETAAISAVSMCMLHTEMNVEESI